MASFVLPLLGGYLDTIDGGSYLISGFARKESVPGRYKVRLFEKRTGRLVRQTWSDEDGAFSFPNLAYKEYFVMMHDHTGSANLSAFDSIFPVPQ